MCRGHPAWCCQPLSGTLLVFVLHKYFKMLCKRGILACQSPHFWHVCPALLQVPRRLAVNLGTSMSHCTCFAGGGFFPEFGTGIESGASGVPIECFFFLISLLRTYSLLLCLAFAYSNQQAKCSQSHVAIHSLHSPLSCFGELLQA